VDRRRVLVTGGTGRVAAQLNPALAERYDLRLMDHADGDDSAGGAPLIVGELTDQRMLDRALDGVQSVVHLAGNPDPAASWRDLREPNVQGFVALLAAAHWPPAPCCAYGATKAFDEALARMYSYRFDMSLVGLRLGLCTPEASPAEAVAGWLGTADLRAVVIRSLEADVRGVYHAVSWPSRRRWNIEPTIHELGYEPDRDAGPGDDGIGQGDDHLSTCTPHRSP
jgi:hypothetical protein